MSNDKILVSVYCLCYNHEKYIRKCLDGFIMQKTNFDFEVIIHDDASTDNSAKIIREYEDKYPDIIKPIYQKENQYSQGIKIRDKYMLPKCKGKYIAICEGDDFWTDENKLQTQVDYMEIHEKCSICGHAYKEVNENGDFLKNIFRKSDQDENINYEDIIFWRTGVSTASLVYRKDLFLERPQFFKETDVGDYPLMLYMASKGDFHYINKSMANYRVSSSGSWTETVLKNPEKKFKHAKIMVKFLKELDIYTEREYHDEIIEKIGIYEFPELFFNRQWWKYFLNIKFKKMSLKSKSAHIFRAILPKLYDKLKKQENNNAQ